MLSTGLRLGLTAGLPALAALAAYLLPARAVAAVRAAGLLALAVSLGFLGSAANLIASGARLAASLGWPIGGVHLLLRADPQGVIVAIAACGAGLLCLAQRGLSTIQVAGLLLCASGGITAALAGNAVMLYAGFELASAGTVVLLGAGGRRCGRAVWAAFTIEQVAGLALLTAGVELQSATGTSDFSVLPAAAVGNGIAVLWLAAGGLQLVAPGLYPPRMGGATYPAWAVTGAIPVAAITLLRLREAVSDRVPAGAGTTVAIIGCGVALSAAAIAVRRRGGLVATGRALVVAAAGAAVAVAGVSGPSALTGLAAGLIAVELAAAVAALWEPHRVGPRFLRMAACLVAGGFPIGFGAIAALLELSALATARRPTSLLLVPVGVAAVLSAGAGARAAVGELRRKDDGAALEPLALVALLAGAAAATVPGLAAVAAVDPLAGGGVARSAGAASVLSPGGGWAGGYLAAAAVVLVLMAVSAAQLAAYRLPALARDTAGHPERRLLPLAPLRRWHRAVLVAGPAIDRVDRWLMLQPQLPMVVAVAVGALLLVH